LSAAAAGEEMKVYCFIPRRPDFSEAEFHDYWRDVHGVLAKPIDTFTAYHQAHRIEVADVPGLATRHDGVAELWFADLEDAAGLAENRIYVETVIPDEQNFMDLGPNAFRVLTQEWLLAEDGFDPDRRGVKLLHSVRRAPGLGREEFAERFAAAEKARVGGVAGVNRQALSLARPETYGEEFVPFDGVMHRWLTPEPFDAVRELWWPDREAARAALGDAAAREALLGDELIDRERSEAMLTEEYVVLASGERSPSPQS
jgi:hypothetical protein